MPNFECDEVVYKKFQAFLKEKEQQERLGGLVQNAYEFCKLLHQFTKAANSPRGYSYFDYSGVKIEPPMNRPEYFTVQRRFDYSWADDLEKREIAQFFDYVPIYLIKDKEKLVTNAWMLAQAWGWMFIAKAIRSIFIYDYDTWRWDWGLFWTNFAKHTAEYGLLKFEEITKCQLEFTF